MTTPRKPEDLTIEEIKEQMALFHRLYYYKIKDTPEHKEKRKETQRKYYEKKKAKLEEQKQLEEKPAMNHPASRNVNTSENIKKMSMMPI